MNAAKMRNLSGGQEQGCNYEKGDRYSQARRYAHQATMWGFLLCFAATVSGTVMHYGFALHAPYSLISLPKILGVPGGVLLTLGTIKLAWLKTRADSNLGARTTSGGEMAFVFFARFDRCIGTGALRVHGYDIGAEPHGAASRRRAGTVPADALL